MGRRGIRWWWVVLGLLVGVTLVVPGTREVQVLGVRVIFGVNGRTVVRGQRAGCVIYHVPNVDFSEGYKGELVKEAAGSADGYVVALMTTREPLEPPGVEAWRGHAMAVWAAMEGAARLRFGYRNPPTGFDGRVLEDEEVARRRMGKMLELVAYAQTVEPENGALWLAEAVLRFHLKQEAEAIGALREAARRVRWDSHAEEAFWGVRRMLEERGWPAFNASVTMAWAGLEFSLAAEAQKGLVEQMILAIDGDDERFGSLAELARELQRPAWKQAAERNLFHGTMTEYDLVEAMAQHLGEPSASGEDGVSRNGGQDEELVRRYLTGHMPAAFTDSVFESAEQARLRWVPAYRQRVAAEKEAVWWIERSSDGGAVVLVMMTLVACWLCVGVPFLVGRPDGKQSLWRSVGFCATVGMVIYAGAYVWKGLLDALPRVFGLLGYQPGDDWTHSMEDPVIIGMMAMAVMLGVRIALWPREKVVRGISVGLGVVNLVAVVVSAYLKSEAVRSVVRVGTW